MINEKRPITDDMNHLLEQMKTLSEVKANNRVSIGAELMKEIHEIVQDCTRIDREFNTDESNFLLLSALDRQEMMTYYLSKLGDKID